MESFVVNHLIQEEQVREKDKAKGRLYCCLQLAAGRVKRKKSQAFLRGAHWQDHRITEW